MKKLIPIIALMAFMLSSCEGWLDINTDPNNPSEIIFDKILPGVNYDMAYEFGMQYYRLGYFASVYTHQLTTRESIDQYGINGSDVNNPWASIYVGPVKEIETLIEEATKKDNMFYAGIGKVYKAYIFSQLVDLFGNVPYSEASVSENYNPAFDIDKEIYQSILDLLDEAVVDLTNEESENLNVPGSDDLIYGGDPGLWVKAANSIKLKLMVQAMNTDLYSQSEVDALLAGDLIGPGEDMLIPYGPERSPDNRNPGFVGEYGGSQISSYISPWFFEILNGENDDIFTGIQDPRIPYYFCTQLADPADVENPSEYQNGNFVSIYFGSVGVNRDHGGRNTFTMLGMYPVGGAFDDPLLDKSSQLGIENGTGVAPFRILTYADVLFLKAELAAKGKTSDDLRLLLEDAIYEAFSQVDMVSDIVRQVFTDNKLDTIKVGYPELLSGSDAEANYVAAVLAEFDAANAEKQFEIVMTQKWISKFGAAIDAYTDYRRTGYPVLFDPNSMPADGGPDGNGDVPCQATRDYALSFPWSSDELNMNENAPSQKVPATSPVFWDK
ncbi:MAG: SusD/RagB family nutrient-binding outer membrane lipoprotein [Prolixibacteraceae bacterium]|nr:SusD/RagB family nutrient-binding outer membrane lipoprotein [Prolixibacteraceae bacterium]